MKRLIIVPCSATKNPLLKLQNLPAREAYKGSGFQLTREYVEGRYDWVILSAKYGIILPDFPVEDYEYKMPDKLSDWVVKDPTINLTSWAGHWVFDEHDEFICLGGTAYCQAAETLFQNLKTPLKGLTIGRMLAKLKNGNWDNEKQTDSFL